MGLVAVDGVLGQGTLAPGVGTANAVDIQVDIQIDEATTFYFIGMAHVIQISLTIVPGTDAEGLPAVDAEGVTSP